MPSIVSDIFPTITNLIFFNLIIWLVWSQLWHSDLVSCACMLSHVQLFATPWTVDRCQVPLSMGFPKKEYWSGLPFPLPGDLLNPGTELTSASPALASDFTTETPGKLSSFLTRDQNQAPYTKSIEP